MKITQQQPKQQHKNQLSGKLQKLKLQLKNLPISLLPKTIMKFLLQPEKQLPELPQHYQSN